MDNSLAKVELREKILSYQDGLFRAVESGQMKSFFDVEKLVHYFTPRDPRYGCYMYGRALLIPKGYEVVGRIHKYACLNFFMMGEVAVVSEDGSKIFKAPDILVSEPGVKRAVYAIEDTIWTTVHLVSKTGEENVDEIVDELTVKKYEDLEMIASIEELRRLEGVTK